MLVDEDKNVLNIELNDKEVILFSKWKYKKMIKQASVMMKNVLYLNSEFEK